MALYLQIQGINGSVSATGVNNAILINSLQHHGAQTISVDDGSKCRRVQGGLTFHDVTVIKPLDCSSSSLLHAFYTAKVIPMVTCIFAVTGDQLLPVVKEEFKNAIITHYETCFHSTGMPTEKITLNISAITMRYMGADNKGNGQSPRATGYDFVLRQVF